MPGQGLVASSGQAVIAGEGFRAAFPADLTKMSCADAQEPFFWRIEETNTFSV
jgi:hypothetical protein